MIQQFPCLWSSLLRRYVRYSLHQIQQRQLRIQSEWKYFSCFWQHDEGSTKVIKRLLLNKVFKTSWVANFRRYRYHHSKFSSINYSRLCNNIWWSCPISMGVWLHGELNFLFVFGGVILFSHFLVPWSNLTSTFSTLKIHIIMASSVAIRSLGRLQAPTSAFLLCDVQEVWELHYISLTCVSLHAHSSFCLLSYFKRNSFASM